MVQMEQWEGFQGRLWKEEINTLIPGILSRKIISPTTGTSPFWKALQRLRTSFGEF